ncbi:MAG: hypothetical protein ABI306_07970, partial [Caulobacteraceae bacterium]
MLNPPPSSCGGGGGRPPRSSSFLLAALTVTATTLAGCGFTPLYATPGVSPGLAAIEVLAPQGRVGFLIREDLDDALGHDKTAAPAWRLDMAVTQTRDPRG